MKKIRIATLGQSVGYRISLIPRLIDSLGYRIEWVDPKSSELIIFGPRFSLRKQSLRMVPKVFRRFIEKPFVESLQTYLGSREFWPVRLFHTREDVRHDFMDADYAISSDLTLDQKTHFRFPVWMESLDWSHEGIVREPIDINDPYLQINRLMSPLGDSFIERVSGGGRAAAFVAEQLREPYTTCMHAVERAIRVDGFGGVFDLQNRAITKYMVNLEKMLQAYAFNLCPESTLYPGYITSKIPKAFASGCLPITWVDQSVKVDFNAQAFINLAPMAADCYIEIESLKDERFLEKFAGEALLLNQPTLDPIKEYLKAILIEATN